MNNRITVVTVVFNDKDGLEKTIQSVLSQTYNSMEYIIIDGGSTDGTVDIIKKYEDKIDKWVSEPDKGIYDAMNKGIKMASGEWINFMNAGDIFVDTKVLDTLSQYFIGTNDVIYGNHVKKIYGSFYEFRGNHQMIDSTVFPTMGFCHQASFVKRNLASKIMFDIHFSYAADYKMIRSLYKDDCSFIHINIPIVLYDISGISSKNVYRCNYEKFEIAFPNSKFKNHIKNFYTSSKMILRDVIYSLISNMFPIGFANYYSSKKNLRNVEKLFLL